MSLDVIFFFFKQKTAYEMRISDWSSDVCSSDLTELWRRGRPNRRGDKGPSPQFNAILDELLPTYLLRARILVGDCVDEIDAALESTRQTRSFTSFESHTERELRGMRFLMEIELLQHLGLLTQDRLQSAEKALRASDHGPFRTDERRV